MTRLKALYPTLRIDFGLSVSHHGYRYADYLQMRTDTRPAELFHLVLNLPMSIDVVACTREEIRGLLGLVSHRYSSTICSSNKHER